MEAALRVVSAAVRELPVVHVVLAAAVAPHHAHQHQHQQQERQRQHHADEPSRRRSLVLVGLHDRTVCTYYNATVCKKIIKLWQMSTKASYDIAVKHNLLN